MQLPAGLKSGLKMNFPSPWKNLPESVCTTQLIYTSKAPLEVSKAVRIVTIMWLHSLLDNRS